MGGSRGTADGWRVSTVSAVTVVGSRVSESSDSGLMLRERPWRRGRRGFALLYKGVGHAERDHLPIFAWVVGLRA